MNPTEKTDLYMTIRNIRYRYSLDQFEDQALAEIQKMVKRTRTEIVKALDDKYKGTVWANNRNRQILDELDRLTVGVKAQLGEDISEVSSIAYEESVKAHNSILSIGGRAANVSAVLITGEQVAAFLSEPIGGLMLAEWVDRTFDYPLQEKLRSDLSAGFFRGEPYRKLSKRINGLLGDTITNTDTLVRSWVQGANVKAQAEVMINNANLIAGWKWDAVLENGNLSSGRGVCLRCLSLDARNELYPVNGGPRIPLHPNCRCVRRMVTKSWRDLGIPLDDLDDAVRPYAVRGKLDPVTGTFKRKGKTGIGGVPLIDSGRINGGMDVFFNSLPASLQEQTLGNKRFDLWKKGKIKLADLADKNGNQLTIKKLVKK